MCVCVDDHVKPECIVMNLIQCRTLKVSSLAYKGVINFFSSPVCRSARYIIISVGLTVFHYLASLMILTQH